jgi:hypothetical protein
VFSKKGGTAMDALALATTAVAFLSPYLVKAGEKAAEEVGKKLPEAAAGVWNAIITKFRGNVVAEAAVKDLVEQPGDQLNQSTFVNQLRKALEAEPEFATELAHLLEEGKRQSGDTISNTGSGAVATGGGVAAGVGGAAVRGDVQGGIHIGGSEKKG